MAFKMTNAPYKNESKSTQSPVYTERKDGKITYYTNDGNKISKDTFLNLQAKWRNKDS
tara:strand:- start:197 stop:370 length:174 start_codon:yes stop_codon:yes gene_type:complete